MRYFSWIAFLFALPAFSQNSADSSIYFYELGNAAVHQRDLEKAEYFYTRSLTFKLYADTYYNRAVVRRARSNFQGYCNDLEWAANMGDTLSYEEFWHYCGTIDTVPEIQKQIGSTRSVVKRAAFKSFQDRSDFDKNGKLLLRYFVEQDDTTYIDGSLLELSLLDTTKTEGKAFKYIQAHIQYPPDAKEKGIEGTVWLSMIITKEGKLKNLFVVKGIPGGLTETAVQVIREIPAWLPPRVFGRKVNRRFKLPVKFVLR